MKKCMHTVSKNNVNSKHCSRKGLTPGWMRTFPDKVYLSLHYKYSYVELRKVLYSILLCDIRISEWKKWQNRNYSTHKLSKSLRTQLEWNNKVWLAGQKTWEVGNIPEEATRQSTLEELLFQNKTGRMEMTTTQRTKDEHTLNSRPWKWARNVELTKNRKRIVLW